MGRVAVNFAAAGRPAADPDAVGRADDLLRLLRKKAVRRQSQGKSFLYSAAIARDEYQYAVGRNVIDRLFDGLAGNFLTCLVRNEAFRPGELEELRRLLDEKAAEQQTTTDGETQPTE